MWLWPAIVPPLQFTAEFTTLTSMDQYSWCALLGDFLHVSMPVSRCQVVLLNIYFIVVLISGFRPVPSRVVVALLPVGSPLFARSSIPPTLPAHAHVPSCAHLPRLWLQVTLMKTAKANWLTCWRIQIILILTFADFRIIVLFCVLQK